jgi:hypothetical protein
MVLEICWKEEKENFVSENFVVHSSGYGLEQERRPRLIAAVTIKPPKAYIYRT